MHKAISSAVKASLAVAGMRSASKAEISRMAMDGTAKIAMRQLGQIIGKLPRQRLIEAELGAQLAAVGHGGGFAQHHFHRVARHQMHQQKGQQQHAEHDREHTKQTFQHARYQSSVINTGVCNVHQLEQFQHVGVAHADTAMRMPGTPTGSLSGVPWM